VADVGAGQYFLQCGVEKARADDRVVGGADLGVAVREVEVSGGGEEGLEGFELTARGLDSQIQCKDRNIGGRALEHGKEARETLIGRVVRFEMFVEAAADGGEGLDFGGRKRKIFVRVTTEKVQNRRGRSSALRTGNGFCVQFRGVCRFGKGPPAGGRDHLRFVEEKGDGIAVGSSLHLEGGEDIAGSLDHSGDLFQIAPSAAIFDDLEEGGTGAEVLQIQETLIVIKSDRVREAIGAGTDGETSGEERQSGKDALKFTCLESIALVSCEAGDGGDGLRHHISAREGLDGLGEAEQTEVQRRDPAREERRVFGHLAERLEVEVRWGGARCVSFTANAEEKGAELDRREPRAVCDVGEDLMRWARGIAGNGIRVGVSELGGRGNSICVSGTSGWKSGRLETPDLVNGEAEGEERIESLAGAWTE
jgi:hypothetical protein